MILFAIPAPHRKSSGLLPLGLANSGTTHAAPFLRNTMAIASLAAILRDSATGLLIAAMLGSPGSTAGYVTSGKWRPIMLTRPDYLSDQEFEAMKARRTGVTATADIAKERPNMKAVAADLADGNVDTIFDAQRCGSSNGLANPTMAANQGGGKASRASIARDTGQRLSAVDAAAEPLPLIPPIAKSLDYPVDALGPILANAAKAIAAKCQCPIVMAAQSILSVASLAAQRLADVRLPYGQTRPLSLFLVTIAASGDRKSSADNEALVPIRKHEKTLKKQFEKLSREHPRSETDEPKAPIMPILTAPEPTVEALAKHWRILPGSLGLFSAEGGQLTGGHGFSPDHRLKTAATLATLWDGAGIRRLRAGDGITDLPGRRLVIHIMIQPDAATSFLSEPALRDQGLLSRFLIAAPESLAGTRLWQDPNNRDELAFDGYTTRIVELLEHPAESENEAGNELTPRPIDLTQEAKSAWVQFHDRVEMAMGPDGPFENLRDVAGKAAENAARIAGILTIVDDPCAPSIAGGTMASACELMTWYLNEALRLSGLHRHPPALRNAVSLLAWLQAKGKEEISVREIMQFGPSAIRRKAEAEAALSRLEEHGWLAKLGEGRGARWRIVKVAPQ